MKEFGASAGGYDYSRDLGVEMFVDFDQFVYGKGEAELAARTLGLGVRASPFIVNKTGSVSDGERALRQAQATLKCGITLGGGGLNPAVVAGHTTGLTPTADDVRDAHRVIEQFSQFAATGQTWREVDGRIIDRYEAARARGTLDWAALCAARDKQKAAAVAAVNALPLPGT